LPSLYVRRPAVAATHKFNEGQGLSAAGPAFVHRRINMLWSFRMGGIFPLDAIEVEPPIGEIPHRAFRARP
jgi:hypothetical protein